MKLTILVLCLVLFSSMFMVNSQREALKWLYGNQDSDDCDVENRCILSKKTQGIFPLGGEEKGSDSPMNVFSWKFLYFYKGKLSVFVTDQTPCPDKYPPHKGDDIQKIDQDPSYAVVPEQTDFEMNFPLETLSTPCDVQKDICTLKKMQDQVFKLNNLEYDWSKVNGVSEHFKGEEQMEKCLILTQSITEDPLTETPFICNKNILDFQAMKWALNMGVEDLQFEVTARVKRLRNGRNRWNDCYLHWDDGVIRADDIIDPSDIENITEEQKNAKPYAEYSCEAKQFTRPAEFVTEENGNVPYRGDDPSSVPEFDRCFFIPHIKDTKKKGKKKRKDYYCAMGDLDGTEEWDVLKASLTIIQYVSDYNRKFLQCKEGAAREEGAKFTETHPKTDETMIVFKYIVQAFALKFKSDCLDQTKEKPPVKTEEQCDKFREKAINAYIEDLCGGNQFCIDSMKPFEESKVNPPVFDEDDCDEPPCPPKNCTKKVDGMKEAEDLAGQYNVPKPTAAEEEDCGTGQNPNKPSKDDFMKAINTIKVIAGELGGAVPDLSSVMIENLNDYMCPAGGDNLGLRINLIPFCSKIDTWFELFGYIHSKYSGM